MTQLPGDSFLVKLALVNAKTFLLQRGLESLTDFLPDSIIEKLMPPEQETPKEPSEPEKVQEEGNREPIPASTESVEKKSSLHTRESQTSNEPREGQIKSDTDLVQVMKDITDPQSERNRNRVKDESKKNSNPYFEDDWKIPYGGSFTLLPPYIQI